MMSIMRYYQLVQKGFVWLVIAVKDTIMKKNALTIKET